MIIRPRIRGFICTTAHPAGCAVNVRAQIARIAPVSNGPRKALVLGASGGYGLASRIVAAFGAGADTLGVSFERVPTATRTASAGWYNNVAFEEAAAERGLYAMTLDGDAFAALLGAIPAGKQLVVNATSASGAVLESWAGEGRTLITATRTGGERNATRFSEHWAAALSSDEADANKNGAITAQEAFEFAARKVSDSYENAGTLATEHPQLVGDAPGAFNVALLEARIATTVELEDLIGELGVLEEDIDRLRARRDEMTIDIYLGELQDLLLALALVQREIDEIRTAE